MSYNVKHPTEASIELIGQAISESGAQLVALQEASPAETRHIARTSGLSAHTAPEGLGIAAAEPVDDTLYLDLDGPGGLFAARLESGLWFATAHLSPTRHEAQARELANRISDELDQAPWVVGGDLNALPHDLRPLLSRFEERARWTVDYLLVLGGRIDTWTAITSYASDHFPIVADIEIEVSASGARAR